MLSKRSNRRRHAAAALAATGLAAAILASATFAGEFGQFMGRDISWNTVDCGGGTSSGQSASGSIELVGTIGQPDAHFSGSLTGGAYQFAPGFWRGTSLMQTVCPADVAPQPNGNSIVNTDDLLLVISTWGPGGAGDVNHDGAVNVDDMIAVIVAWGACP
jgi:hypothetical protein